MRNNILELFINNELNQPLYFEVKQLINAGYTGRNQEEVLKHVEELKEMGVPAPEKIPTYYLKGKSLLTTSNLCQVVDQDSTGEAEYVLLIDKKGIFVGAGSDHTDRKLEITNIPKAKQICPNFISRGVWPFDEVKEHWDEISLCSWIGQNRGQLYQEARLSSFMRPEELIERVRNLQGGTLMEGTVIFSGTVGALIGGMPFSDYFEVELHDIKRQKKLNCGYIIQIMDDLNK